MYYVNTAINLSHNEEMLYLAIGYAENYKSRLVMT